MPVRTSNLGSRARPLSITTRTPSTVSEVSAMSVDSTTRRRPTRDGRECGVLLGECERPGQGVDVDVVGHRAAEDLLGATDLADAGQEHEQVARLLPERLRHGGGHGVLGSGAPVGGQPAHVDRVGAALALDHRGVTEHPGECDGVGRGRHRQDAEVGTQVGGDVERESEPEIGDQVALVHLVEHDQPDAGQLRIALEPACEDAFGDDFDAGVRPDVALVARLVSDRVADLFTEQVRPSAAPRHGWRGGAVRARRCGAAAATARRAAPTGRGWSYRLRAGRRAPPAPVRRARPGVRRTTP